EPWKKPCGETAAGERDGERAAQSKRVLAVSLEIRRERLGEFGVTGDKYFWLHHDRAKALCHPPSLFELRRGRPFDDRRWTLADRRLTIFYFVHPPISATRRSASGGPVVPHLYSYCAGSPSTGSTILQEASTTSWLPNSVASPTIASPRSRSYASICPLTSSTTESSTGSPAISSPGRFARAPITIVT